MATTQGGLRVAPQRFGDAQGLPEGMPPQSKCEQCGAMVDVLGVRDAFGDDFFYLSPHSYEQISHGIEDGAATRRVYVMRCRGSNEEVADPRPTKSVVLAAPEPSKKQNPYAAAGRAEKVRKIVEKVDEQARMSPHAPPGPKAIADWLAGIDMHTWIAFAKQIGVQTPSAETIAAVLDVYRARAMHAAETAQRQTVSP